MKVKEKQELVRLLNIYMDDLVATNDFNIKKVKEYGGKRWECAELKTGVKAQYEHARIIASKLSVEIGKEMKSYWELL